MYVNTELSTFESEDHLRHVLLIMTASEDDNYRAFKVVEETRADENEGWNEQRQHVVECPSFHANYESKQEEAQAKFDDWVTNPAT